MSMRWSEQRKREKEQSMLLVLEERASERKMSKQLRGFDEVLNAFDENLVEYRSESIFCFSSGDMQPDRIFPLSSSAESIELPRSRVPMHGVDRTLPSSVHHSTLTRTTTTFRTMETQTVQENASAFTSKSVPSFADTQLLSVYYPTSNPPAATSDSCIFVEQQTRQPVRFRTAYDPLSSTKSTQTSPPSSSSSGALSTDGSTLVIGVNYRTDGDYEQRVKIHSGPEHTRPNELPAQSRYSYEEYVVHVQNDQQDTSSSSTPTTVITQQNSDSNSIHSPSSASSTASNHQQPTTRVSSWPPVPDEILDDSHEQRRPTRVQFADHLIHVIPPPADTRSIQEQPQRFDHHPINQSKWVRDRLDTQPNSTGGRVDVLRTVFEQQGARSSDSSSATSPTPRPPRLEPEEKPSKHGDEIRFRVQEPHTSSVHHAQPAKIVHPTNPAMMAPLTWEDLLGVQQDYEATQPTPVFRLDQLRDITGKPLNSLDDVGRYLQVCLIDQRHVPFIP